MGLTYFIVISIQNGVNKSRQKAGNMTHTEPDTEPGVISFGIRSCTMKDKNTLIRFVDKPLGTFLYDSISQVLMDKAQEYCYSYFQSR